MSFFYRVAPSLKSCIPTVVQDSLQTTSETLASKVGSFYRGIQVYAYKSPAGTNSLHLRFLESRAKFINPSLPEFVKTLVFYGIPAGIAAHSLRSIKMGKVLPFPTIVTAIIGLIALVKMVGFIRQVFIGNDLDKALRAIISHSQPGKTLEDLPALHFVNNRVEMGNHPIGVIRNPKTAQVDYVAFRYIEKTDEGEKTHTRVFSLGANWIHTGTTVEPNHIYDISTSLEGNFIADLLAAARGATLAVQIPPSPPSSRLKAGLKMIVRLLSPDEARQTISTMGKEFLKSAQTSYWGKGTYLPPENKKGTDFKFLGSRDKFVNLIPLQLFKSILLFGPIGIFCARHLVKLKVGPFMPLTASLAAYVGIKCLKQLSGAFLQYLSGNDLERALISIVRISAPSVQAQPGRTVLDALPANGTVSAVKTNDGKATHVTFRYREGTRDISRTYFIAKSWFHTKTLHPAGNSLQTSTSLESRHIEKLLEAGSLSTP